MKPEFLWVVGDAGRINDNYLQSLISSSLLLLLEVGKRDDGREFEWSQVGNN